MAKQKTLAFSAELLDQRLDGQDPTTVLRSDGLMGELKKALAERMLNAEMDVHLDAEVEQATGNHRNGSTKRRSWATTANGCCRSPVIGTVVSIRRSFASTNDAFPVLTSRSSRCTPVA